MKETVTRVSPYGFQTKEQGSDLWLNTSKFAKGITLDGIEPGSVVDYEFKEGANGKRYLTKLSLSNGNVDIGARSEGSPEPPRRTNSEPHGTTFARAAAVKAAFGPALEAFLSKSDTVSDAVEQAEALAERLNRYISTGKFDAADDRTMETANA